MGCVGSKEAAAERKTSKSKDKGSKRGTPGASVDLKSVINSKKNKASASDEEGKESGSQKTEQEDKGTADVQAEAKEEETEREAGKEKGPAKSAEKGTAKGSNEAGSSEGENSLAPSKEGDQEAGKAAATENLQGPDAGADSSSAAVADGPGGAGAGAAAAAATAVASAGAAAAVSSGQLKAGKGDEDAEPGEAAGADSKKEQRAGEGDEDEGDQGLEGDDDGSKRGQSLDLEERERELLLEEQQQQEQQQQQQQEQQQGPERVPFLTSVQPPSPPMGPSVVEVPGTSCWLRFSYLTQRGYYPEAPGKANQDSFCVVPQFGGVASDFLFGVFDGHGEHGTPCSQFSRDKLCENMLRHPQLDSDVAASFRDSFLLTNMQLHASPIDDTMSGSTGIACFMRNLTLYAANVGDSRAVLAQWMGGGQNGEERLVAVDLSSDQTPFRADECERVKASGARVLTLDQLEGLKDPNVQCWGGEEDDDGDPPRLWVQSGMYPGTAFTRSLGDSVAEKIGVSADPEIMALEVNPQQHPFFVIASDGVFEFLSSQDVVDMVAQHNDPHAACAQVVAESYRLWLQYETRTDDITIIIVHLDDRPPPVRGGDSAGPQASTYAARAASSQASSRPFPLPGAALMQRSMLSDMAAFHRRAIEGSDLDFRPSIDPALDALPRKNDTDQERLLMAIRNNFLFHMLPEEELELVLKAFETRELVPGDVIIQQGEEGDRFFVCDNGEFDVLVETGQDEDELGTVVHRYVADAGHAPSFGDLALMYGTRREASVRAASDGRIWALQRSLFRSIQTRPVALDQLTPSPASTRTLRALRSLPFLAPLSFCQLQRLAFFMKLIEIPKGSTAELDPDCVYVFFEGEVEEERSSEDPEALPDLDREDSGAGALLEAAEGRDPGTSGAAEPSAEAGKDRDLAGGAGPPISLNLSIRSRRHGSYSHPSYPSEGLKGGGAAGAGRFMPQWIGEEVLLDPKKVSEDGTSSASTQNGVGTSSNSSRRTRRVKATGNVVGRYISRQEFEGAVGSLPAQSEVDTRLRSFQASLHMERQQRGRQKSLDDVVSAEVEWIDTLSSTEWSELGQVCIRSLGENLSMKRFGKERVARAGRETQVLRERMLIQTLTANPFVPPVITPYIDTKNVGLLLDCQLAVPLALLLGEPVPEDCAQFIAASLVLALQLLHKDGLVFRGVAPATIFLDAAAMVQLPDLRFSKRLTDGRTFTLCRYPDFVAPEMITGMGHGQATDWWALGVLIYAMLQGEGPFGSWKDSELQVYTRIARRTMDYPDHFSPEAVSLVDQLLAFNPEDRLGCGVGGAEAVKEHAWFQGISWEAIANRQCSPPALLRERLAELQEQRVMILEGQKEMEEQQQSYLDIPSNGATEEGEPAAKPEGESPWFEGW